MRLAFIVLFSFISAYKSKDLYAVYLCPSFRSTRDRIFEGMIFMHAPGHQSDHPETSSTPRQNSGKPLTPKEIDPRYQWMRHLR
jgi:hypothetical protein